MSVLLDLTELLDYSDYERCKWKEWIAADSRRLDIPFQRDGRFPTIGSLFDHTFLVERRHLARLQGGTPPGATGVAHGDWKALFEYAELVRADFRKYLADVDQPETLEPITIVAQSATRTMARRQLATHIVLHEVRHMAQIAFAVRASGAVPPGDHDLFYFAAEA
jgi:uncharacterized damage-inducible protein DinB